MFSNNTMSIWESFIISSLGLTIVFLALVALALLILIFSKIFESLIKEKFDKVVSTNKSENEKNHDEEYAVLISAIHEELRTMRGKFKIVSIKEIKQ